MKSLKTVNILESVDGSVQSLKSFPDNKAGNLAAENLFTKCCQENQPEDRSAWLGIDYYLEEGCYSNGDYFLYLIHST